MAYIKRYIGDAVRWLEENPLVTLIIAAVILFFSIFKMSERQSSAGQWGIIIVCVFLIMWAFGNLTGLGFGMSF